MRDFDLEKSNEAFLNYMKWRVGSKVDMISKVIIKTEAFFFYLI